jgi:hypothetical protein
VTYYVCSGKTFLLNVIHRQLARTKDVLRLQKLAEPAHCDIAQFVVFVALVYHPALLACRLVSATPSSRRRTL